MKSKRTRKLLGTTILLTWYALILTTFVYLTGSISHVQGASLHEITAIQETIANFPFTNLLLSTLLSSIGMMFYGVSCISLGITLTTLFLRLNKRSDGDSCHQIGIHLSTCLLVGNATFSLVLLILASVLYLSPILSLAILSFGFLSGMRQLKKIFFPSIQMPVGQTRIIALLAIAILAVSIFQTSARISYDATAVYFSNAKLTATEQTTVFFTKDTFVASVFHSIIPLSAVIQVFGDQSARMITWLFGIVNIVIVFAISEHTGTSTRSRYILLPLILTTTAFVDLLGDGKVDLISSAYALGGIYWLIARAKKTDQLSSQFILSGSLIGFACILRPYNAFLLGIFTLVHLAQELKGGSSNIRNVKRQTTLLVAGAAGFAIYHLLINKIILGSPVAFLTSLTSINPVNGPWDYDPKTVWIERLLYPIIVTFKNSPSSLGSITPLVLVLLSALTTKDIRKNVILPKELIQLSFSSGVTLYAWIFLFFTIAEIRYVMFLWFILFIPVAEVATSVLTSKNTIIKNAVSLCIILLMSFILVRSIYISTSKYAPLDTDGNPQCNGDGFCSHVASINKIADKDDRVLTLSAFRYYLRTDLFACSTSAEEYHILQELSFTNPDAFWQEIYRQGYKYIAYEKDYSTRHLQFGIVPSPDNTPEWVDLEPIFGKPGGLLTAYKIHVSNPPVKFRKTCSS